MPRPNTAEITAVGGHESSQLKPLGYGDKRSVYQAEKVVLRDQLRRSVKIGTSEMLRHDFPGSQGLRKLLFGGGAQSAADEVSSLREHSARREQDLVLYREKFAHRLMPKVVSVCQGVNRAGIEQERHQLALRRRPFVTGTVS
jgi:hypothetical protein